MQRVSFAWIIVTIQISVTSWPEAGEPYARSPFSGEHIGERMSRSGPWATRRVGGVVCAVRRDAKKMIEVS